MKKIFEWDDDKARANIRNHKVSFEEASSVFGDLLSATVYDPDHSMDDDRYIIVFCAKLKEEYAEFKESFKVDEYKPQYEVHQ